MATSSRKKTWRQNVFDDTRLSIRLSRADVKRDDIRRRFQEREVVCHAAFVIVSQVAVNPADQDASIAMAEP